jgi:hypothetical protein
MRKKLTDYWYNYRIAAPNHRSPECHQAFMMGAFLALSAVHNVTDYGQAMQEELNALFEEAEEYARLSNHPLARKKP